MKERKSKGGKERGSEGRNEGKHENRSERKRERGKEEEREGRNEIVGYHLVVYISKLFLIKVTLCQHTLKDPNHLIPFSSLYS